MISSVATVEDIGSALRMYYETTDWMVLDMVHRMGS